MSEIFTSDASPVFTAGFEDVIETLKSSVGSTSGSSTISISTCFGPVSPGANVTSTFFETKSPETAVFGAVDMLKKALCPNFFVN